MIRSRLALCFALLVAVLFISSGPAQAAGPALKLATTTSTANTGLLDYLAPIFKRDTGIELKYIAVGTGKALKLGANCDVDALMVHAPAAEKKYLADGFGVDRRLVMYNDFVIIGPASDPAGIKGKSALEAMKALAAKKAAFASRGDESGTNKKEKRLWRMAGLAVPDKAAWYIQTGQGILATINLAAERGAYTLTDRGTYIKYEANHQGRPPLKILVEGDKILFNQYSVMAVNPARCPAVRKDLADRFADWITSAGIQRAIGEFRLLGKPLFTPNAQ